MTNHIDRSLEAPFEAEHRQSTVIPRLQLLTRAERTGCGVLVFGRQGWGVGCLVGTPPLAFGYEEPLAAVNVWREELSIIT